jgi:hypothetical protein
MKNENELKANAKARLMTLDEIIKNVVPVFFEPPPCNATIRNWLQNSDVPRFKANPTAKRGGGKAYYSVTHVEKLFRRLLPGKLVAA